MELYNDTSYFLNSLESENTRKTYLKGINDFLLFLFNKKIENVTKDELINSSINYQTMVRYKVFLSENGSEGQTIRTKIYSVISWLTYLYKAEYSLPNPIQLRLERKVMPKINDNNGSKPFTHSEMTKMIEKANNYANGKAKSILLELAYMTSWRKEALLNIVVKDIYKLKDKNNYYLVDCVDKGQKQDTKPITLEFYERINSLIIERGLKDDDKIFDFTAMTCDRLIDALKKDLNIRGDKTFHSIRKSSINRVLDLTDNLILAKKHANHESIVTTEKFYIKNNLDFSDNVALFLMNSIDDTKFDNLTREELLNLVKGSEDKIKFSLLTKLEKTSKVK